jgi:hypothetical protein
MAREIRGTAPSGTLYARIMSPAGLWWNGSTFEAYSAGNYSTYVVTMAEQGNSGVYVADFPSGITGSGSYQYFVHKQLGGSPAEGDTIVAFGTVDWTGSASVTASSGAMSGSDWYAYVLRQGFKRTDKETEVYECTTDAIQEMRRRFNFNESQTEATTTDTITVEGDFKLTAETDLGFLTGIVLEDDDIGTPLTQLNKSQYDQMYPGVNVESDRGYPRHYCYYAGQIYIGPIPDRQDYVYRLTYSRSGGTITTLTTGVPFTALYRDILLEKVFERLYEMLGEEDEADRHEARFERLFATATHQENVNSGAHMFTQRPIDR